MCKFSFTDDPGNRVIRHNLEPEMLIQVIYNREDAYLDLFNDCFELFEFRGNEIILKWLADDDELEEIEDFNHVRSILRRSWKWYRSQVYIEEFKPEHGPVETARYALSFRMWKTGENRTYDWVLTDKIFLINIFWLSHKFNESQRIEILPGSRLTPDNAAQLMREAGEWLVKHHSDKL